MPKPKKKKSRIALARQRQRRFRKFLGKSHRRERESEVIDYKNSTGLQKLLSQQGKLFSRKRTGFPASRQRALKLHVKYARYLGLLPYVG